mmetsp:Transcript_15452/g.42508  ORF Transcript_15452/g.42508 Transcript_15452/m.42508 type:complete len:215 (+) Transcript_15452:362-1006(+)
MPSNTASQPRPLCTTSNAKRAHVFGSLGCGRIAAFNGWSVPIATTTMPTHAWPLAKCVENSWQNQMAAPRPKTCSNQPNIIIRMCNLNHAPVGAPGTLRVRLATATPNGRHPPHAKVIKPRCRYNDASPRRFGGSSNALVLKSMAMPPELTPWYCKLVTPSLPCAKITGWTVPGVKLRCVVPAAATARTNVMDVDAPAWVHTDSATLKYSCGIS